VGVFQLSGEAEVKSGDRVIARGLVIGKHDTACTIANSADQMQITFGVFPGALMASES